MRLVKVLFGMRSGLENSEFRTFEFMKLENIHHLIELYVEFAKLPNSFIPKAVALVHDGMTEGQVTAVLMLVTHNYKPLKNWELFRYRKDLGVEQ